MGRRCRPARPRTRDETMFRRAPTARPGAAQPRTQSAAGPTRVRSGMLRSFPGVFQWRRQHPPASGLMPGAGRRDLAAERGMGRGVDGGIPQGNRPDQVAQLEPRQRRGEQDQDVTAAARRDVGDVPAAEALKQLADIGGLAADLSGATFTAVPDSSIVNVTAGAGRVKVKSQQATGTARRAVDRHRARLQWRLGGQRPGPPRRVSAAAVLRRPDVGRTRDQGRDRMPRSLRGGAREAVRNRVCYIRRVARGQWRTDRATC